MRIADRFEMPNVRGADFPRFRGDVKLTLHNCKNGKTEVYEDHNVQTNALKDIFANNYGGLLNYQNFADLYNTWLGGVLVFSNPLDVSSSGWADDYGIPARTSNPCVAHAGQTTLSDQADDLTRGNPDSAQTVLQNGSVKMVWEWGTSAGNGTISSLGLTHADVGSYGCGVVSQAQQSLVPFADIGNQSRSYAYGDNAVSPMAINNNTAYSFYLADNTTVNIYKAPVNDSKFKLQGGSLYPLTDYATKITATLPSSYAIAGHGDCYYHWDFANNKLILFGVPTESGTTLYRDDIDLTSGNVTHSAITVTGAKLWKFKTWNSPTGYVSSLPIPTKAMMYYGCLFVYSNEPRGSYNIDHPRRIFKIDLSNTANITEVDVTDFEEFDYYGATLTANRIASLGGIIVNDSMLINGDKTFKIGGSYCGRGGNRNYMYDGISSPSLGIGESTNVVSACKLYLATKWNLPSTVTKTSAQSMTVEYTLTEV